MVKLMQILYTRDISTLIKSARKAQNLTQDDLAGLSGIGRRFISDLENGKDTAQVGKTLKVISSLGIILTASSQWKS
jgi:HTH-type transcriptional regulator/antitoxin HipB